VAFARAGNQPEGNVQFVQTIRSVSSTRGAWLVGPMKMVENTYDRAGYSAVSDQLRSRSGRRRKGLSDGVAPRSTKWLPPPVPVCRPSSMNFFRAEARLAASS